MELFLYFFMLILSVTATFFVLFGIAEKDREYIKNIKNNNKDNKKL
jgi:hypothetical protein